MQPIYDFLYTLFNRYLDMIKQMTNESIHNCVEMDTLKGIEVKDDTSFMDYKQTLSFLESPL